MIASIIKRYPGLTPQDVRLKDDSDGKGVYISYWKHEKVQPEMADVLKWHEEDMQNYIPPETPEEKVLRLERENAEMKAQSITMATSISELFEMILSQ